MVTRCNQPVAIVTGAGRGLGRSHAVLFSRAGIAVVVVDPGFGLSGNDQDPSVADEVVNEIHASGGTGVASYADLSCWDAADATVETAFDHFGRLDIVINNAGSWHEVLFKDLEPETVERDLAVHVKGTASMMRAAFPHMRRDGGGTIVNTGSTFWLGRSPGFAGYSAAKAAIYSLTQSAAIEGEDFGIRVNTLIPLAVTRQSRSWLERSGWFDASQEDEWSRYSPEWSSRVALWLASSESTGISGRAIQVIPRVGIREIALRGVVGTTPGEDTPCGRSAAALDQLASSHAGREP